MENARKSIRVVTVFVHNAINNHGDDYFSILADVEEEIDAKYMKGDIDARVKESTVVVLFCLKKVLEIACNTVFQMDIDCTYLQVICLFNNYKISFFA